MTPIHMFACDIASQNCLGYFRFFKNAKVVFVCPDLGDLIELYGPLTSTNAFETMASMKSLNPKHKCL